MLAKIKKISNKQNLKYITDVRVLGLIVFFIVVMLVAWSSVRVLELNYELQKKEALLRQKNEIQKLENENLKLRNTYFESNEYLELTARRQLNKAKPGEKLYLVPKEVAYSKTASIEPPKTIKEQAEEKEENQSKYRKNFNDWVNFLFNRQGVETD